MAIYSNYPYRILIIGGSGSVEATTLLNLINNQPDIDKIYLYAKDPYEAKHQYLINKLDKVVLKHFNDPKAFTEYSNNMQKILINTIKVKNVNINSFWWYDCWYD